MSNTRALATAGRIAPPTEDGGVTLGLGARGGATFAEGTTKGATTTKEEGYLIQQYLSDSRLPAR
jgi:hypothetical protein